MNSPECFGENPDIPAVTAWLQRSKETFFNRVSAIQLFAIESIAGGQAHSAVPESIPQCCGFTALVITEALRRMGCSSALTVRGLYRGEMGHAWTQASLGEVQYVLDATYSQFLRTGNDFHIFPATELSARCLTYTGSHPEFNDPWQDCLEERYRLDVRRLVQDLLESLV